MAQKIQQAQLLVKQEQIRKEKERTALIKNLIEDNKQIFNMTAVHELKTDLMKHVNSENLEETMHKRDKPEPKSQHRPDKVSIYDQMAAKLDPDITHSLIVHKKRTFMMMNQAERLTRNINAEDNHYEALKEQLKEYIN